MKIQFIHRNNTHICEEQGSHMRYMDGPNIPSFNIHPRPGIVLNCKQSAQMLGIQLVLNVILTVSKIHSTLTLIQNVLHWQCINPYQSHSRLNSEALPEKLVKNTI